MSCAHVAVEKNIKSAACNFYNEVNKNLVWDRFAAPQVKVSPLGHHEATSQSIRPSPRASICNARRPWVATLCARRSPFHAGFRPVVFFACCLCWRFSLRCPSRLGGSVSSGACGYSDSFGVGARSTLGFREAFTPGASKTRGETIALFRPVV